MRSENFKFELNKDDDIGLSKEQSDIVFFLKNNVFTNNKKVKILLNYKFYSKINNFNTEIDCIIHSTFFFKKTFVFLEYKDFSDRINFDDLTKEIEIKKEKCILKIWEIKNLFLENNKNVYFIYLIKRNNKFEYSVYKINNFSQGDNLSWIKIKDKELELFLSKLLNRYNSYRYFTRYIENKNTKAIESNYYINCLINRICPIIPKCEKNFIEGLNNKQIIQVENTYGGEGTGIAFFIYGYLLKQDKNFLLLFINDFFVSKIKKIFEKNYETINCKINKKLLSNTKNNFEKLITEKVLKAKNEKFYLIVNEAQRLNEDNINFLPELINNNKNFSIILIGNENQKLNPETDVGINALLNKINNVNEKKYVYTVNARKNEKLDHILTYLKYVFCLTNNKPNSINNEELENYKIKIFGNVKFFIEDFKDLINKKNLSIKMTCTQYSDRYLSSEDNNYYSFNKGQLDIFKRQFTFYNYKNKKINKYYENFKNHKLLECLSAYYINSDECDIAYIYLPNFIYTNEKSEIQARDFFIEKEIYLKNQMNVLLTRASKGINVYVQDKLYREKVEQRLSEILKKN